MTIRYQPLCRVEQVRESIDILRQEALWCKWHHFEGLLGVYGTLRGGRDGNSGFVRLHCFLFLGDVAWLLCLAFFIVARSMPNWIDKCRITYEFRRKSYALRG